MFASRPLLSKSIVVGLLIVLLLIPLALVRDVVSERAQRRDEVTAEVARGHATAQVLVGPVVWMPYTETFTRSVPVKDAPGGLREETVTERHVLTLFPRRQDSRVEVRTDTRWRGIFPVTVYESDHKGTARIVWREPVARQPGGRIMLGKPLLLLGVSDPRGLHGTPLLRVNGMELAVETTKASAPEAPTPPLPLAAAFDARELRVDAVLDVAWELGLGGTGSLGWVPLADENHVSLASRWPHPSFGGSFLPRQREVRADGFSANWSVPALSSQAQQQFLREPADAGRWERFSVSLVDPIDLYRLTDRATKYAALFIVLSFAAFFVLELVRRWRIHPMQYLMIGLALVLFYLLLLSLAEHLGFGLAYLAASLACLALLTHYLSHVLGSWRAGAGAGLTLGGLYGVLYAILISEDNALVTGALLLFVVLAIAMVTTRRMNWYELGRADTPPAAATSPAQADERATVILPAPAP